MQFMKVTVCSGTYASENELKQKLKRVISTLRLADKPAVKTVVSQIKPNPGRFQGAQGCISTPNEVDAKGILRALNLNGNDFHSLTKFFAADFLPQRQSIMVSRPVEELPRPKNRKRTGGRQKQSGKREITNSNNLLFPLINF